MKYVLLVIASFLSLTIPLATSQFANAGESAFVSIRDLPAHVREAADANFPDVSWLVARRDQDDWYSLGGLNAARKFVEFRYEDNGARRSYWRVVIKLDELPAAAQAVMQAQYSEVTVTRIQSTGQSDGTIKGYRFEGSNLPAGYKCFYITPDGKKSFLAKE